MPAVQGFAPTARTLPQADSRPKGPCCGGDFMALTWKSAVRTFPLVFAERRPIGACHQEAPSRNCCKNGQLPLERAEKWG
jgi:hypothetical protein